MTDLDHRYLRINGIRMHYVTAGNGPLIVLLHGFPEFWYAWRKQIPALAKRFTVVAPDLRGYNETDKPNWGYETDVLTADVAELIAGLGYERAHVVGHDWGGGLAWNMAIAYPQRVERLAVLNCPHPKLFAEALRSNPRQMLRSWYMGVFQIPWLPEALFRANNFALMENTFRTMVARKDTFSDEDIARYKEALAKPGALTAAINWYRNGASGLVSVGSSSGQVDAPTLLIWGEQDTVLGKELTYGTERYVSNLTIKYLPGCSHWTQQECPDEVNKLLLDFFAPLQ